MNKQIIIGRLGKDPECRQAGEHTVCSFSVAETTKDHTEWFECEAWNKIAGVVQKYLKKGDQVYIEGRTKTDTWEKDGQKHSRAKVVINTLNMLGGVEKKNK